MTLQGLLFLPTTPSMMRFSPQSKGHAIHAMLTVYLLFSVYYKYLMKEAPGPVQTILFQHPALQHFCSQLRHGWGLGKGGLLGP